MLIIQRDIQLLEEMLRREMLKKKKKKKNHNMRKKCLLEGCVIGLNLWHCKESAHITSTRWG